MEGGMGESSSRAHSEMGRASTSHIITFRGSFDYMVEISIEGVVRVNSLITVFMKFSDREGKLISGQAFVRGQ